jgi:hypothetical protein
MKCEIISVPDITKVLSYYSPSNTKFSSNSQLHFSVAYSNIPTLQVPSPILPNSLYYLEPAFIRKGRADTDWEISQ